MNLISHGIVWPGIFFPGPRDLDVFLSRGPGYGWLCQGVSVGISRVGACGVVPRLFLLIRLFLGRFLLLYLSTTEGGEGSFHLKEAHLRLAHFSWAHSISNVYPQSRTHTVSSVVQIRRLVLGIFSIC